MLSMAECYTTVNPDGTPITVTHPATPLEAAPAPGDVVTEARLQAFKDELMQPDSPFVTFQSGG